MRYPEYTWTDSATGGAKMRNHAVDTTEALPFPREERDCFLGMFRFKEEYRELIESTGSVRGAHKLECYSDHLWFDIDCDDLADATLDVQALLRLIRTMGALEHTVAFYSGSKGYHVGVNADLFGFEPSVDLPSAMRGVALAMAELAEIEIDGKVYNTNRLWRTVNTLHGKTNLRKTEIDPSALLDMSLAEVQGVAAVNDGSGGPSYPTCEPVESIGALVRLREANTRKPAKDTGAWEAPPITASSFDREVLALALRTGCKDGSRNDAAYLRAVKCRKAGYTQADATDKMEDWNELNSPPLPSESLHDTIVSAFSGDECPDLGFGSHPELKALFKAVRNGAGSPSPQQNSSLKEVLNELPTVMKHGSLRVFDIKTLTQVPELTAPPVLALLGMAVIDSNTVIAGDSGSGKSTAVRSAVIQEAQRGHKTIWMSAEFERRAAWWFQRMYPHMKDGEILWVDTRLADCSVVQTCAERWEAFRTILKEAHDDFGCEFVVIDSLLGWLQWLDDEVPDNSDPAKWMYKVQQLGDAALSAGMTPLTIHHTNRSGTYALSSGIKGGCDNLWLFAEVGGNNENLRQLKVEKTRDGVEPYMLECMPDQDFHYEVRVDKPQVADPEQQKGYPKRAVAIMRVLLADDAPTKSADIQTLAGTSKQYMSTFKQQYDIATTTKGRTTHWHPTKEQLDEWRSNGVEAPRTTISDAIADERESDHATKTRV